MDVASATWVYHSRKVAFLPDHASHQSFLLTSASLFGETAPTRMAHRPQHTACARMNDMLSRPCITCKRR